MNDFILTFFPYVIAFFGGIGISCSSLAGMEKLSDISNSKIFNVLVISLWWIMILWLSYFINGIATSPLQATYWIGFAIPLCIIAFMLMKEVLHGKLLARGS